MSPHNLHRVVVKTLYDESRFPFLEVSRRVAFNSKDPSIAESLTARRKWDESIYVEFPELV